ncbi:L-rhamnose mutarotase [Lacihabitans lacunae]|uniref:L-rhamnose mutarotase n=1 Tax=Lacihabitans lacunae TaxID=1028214 RepID=A0ABV7YVI2_9BACT
MKRYCLTCDLIDNPELIEKYKWHHLPENQWPEINESIKAAGVLSMEIYVFGNRMFMIMDVSDSFTFEKQAEINKGPKSIEWENLMWGFQQGVPGSKPGEKWVLMEQIFNLV